MPRDPLLCAALFALLALLAWTMVPLASGAAPTRDLPISVTIGTVINVAPPPIESSGGDVSMSAITAPGQQRDSSSPGWHVSSNYAGGYTVQISASTSPALSGHNATDGHGAPASFEDFTTEGCPCPWTTNGFTAGVFGYSATIEGSSPALQDAAKWGTGTARKWRGLTTSPYTLFATGGSGEFDFKLYFRTATPPGISQAAGSYHANVALTALPTT